jgi:uncharacterized RDD family membrane protein YckC
MKRTWLTLAAVLVAAHATVSAQPEFQRWPQQAVRVGQDYTLPAGDTAREVAVIFGNATIEGRVDRNVVVVFGDVRLGSGAVIDGSLVVVGGSATAVEGAQVHEDLFVGGGTFDAPPGFAPGGEHVVVGTAALGGRLQAIVPWVTRGLLWGRPIVPDLPWVWAIVGAFFLVYLFLNLVFDRPVRAAVVVLGDKPLTAFMVGLLVLLLAGPVCLLLAVSVIGIAVVPFVICALVVAAVIGKIAVARLIGSSVVRDDPESRLPGLAAFVIGSIMIVLAYMVPILGFVTWTLGGMFGLGAAALAFIRAYRRENPAPPRPVVAAAPAPAAVAASPAPAMQYHAAAADEYAPATMDHADGPNPAVAPVMPVMPATPIGPLTAARLALPHAAFLDRLAAFTLDVILVLIAVQILSWNDDETARAFFVGLLAYHVGFWTWKGTTVGGIICQLRVVRVDGASLRFADALVRGLSAIFSLAVFGLGALWILRDPEGQAWHDRIAGTYVVKVPRDWPI